MQEIMMGITLGLVAICLIVLIVIACKKQNAIDTKEFDNLTDNLNEVRRDLRSFIESEGSKNKEIILSTVNGQINSFAEYLRSFDDRLDKLSNNLDEDMDKFASNTKMSLQEMKAELKEEVAKMRADLSTAQKEIRQELTDNLKGVREDNEKQLDKMRETVDEKLTETLEIRVKNAFENVATRLESVQKGLGEMKSLSDSVSNLNRAFTNVKTRGGWGEVSLESLLSQILSSEQYKTQFHIQGSERVDFAVVMPGNNDEKVYLPIDAKFPLEDYERLIDASEAGNVEEVASARKKLAASIKEQAKSINKKYIKIPLTTPFAIMYLPTEGLYAEVVKDGALCSDLQSQYQITVCGPTTITALLNSLQIGFTTLKIQKSSGDIVNQLNLFKKDFVKFSDMIAKTKDKAVKVVESLDDIDKRNNKITTQLDKVEGSKALSDVEESLMIEEGK